MNNKEHILQDHEIDAAGSKLRPHLDRAADDVAPHVASRLAAARQMAVAKVAALETKTATSVASQGGTLAISGGWKERATDWRFWATGLIIGAIIAAYGLNQYREASSLRDAAEVELMILGDDVPVDALLDKGFGSFLREENK
ncbi:MAG: DUF3619 family protein [Casimicrobium sp.]